MTIPYAKSALRAENLVKNYGNISAVAGVSLNVHAGECFALLGPNGAGKTTTCEILEGLIAPDTGNVYVCELSYKDRRREILEKIGVQLQETHLYKKYTVAETLSLFASFYRNPQPILPLIQKLRLEEKMHSRLEHLSGGQKQRVYLGCCLVNNPELVFLDEPTSGLDPQARRLIWDLLGQLKQENRSIFLTTHNMEEAQELADRIAIMDHGKIIAQGTVEELITKYAPGQVLAFTADAAAWEPLKADLVWLQQARPVASGFEVTVTNASTALQELTRAADRQGILIHSLAMRQSTLEDVFLKLTGRSIRDD